MSQCQERTNSTEMENNAVHTLERCLAFYPQQASVGTLPEARRREPNSGRWSTIKKIYIYIFRQIWHRNLFLASNIIHECESKIKPVWYLLWEVTCVSYFCNDKMYGRKQLKEGKVFSPREEGGGHDSSSLRQLVTLQQVRSREKWMLLLTFPPPS